MVCHNLLEKNIWIKKKQNKTIKGVQSESRQQRAESKADLNCRPESLRSDRPRSCCVGSWGCSPSWKTSTSRDFECGRKQQVNAGRVSRAAVLTLSARQSTCGCRCRCLQARRVRCHRNRHRPAEKRTHTHIRKQTNTQIHNYGSRESVYNKMRRWQGGEDAAKQSEPKTAAGNDPPTQSSTTAVGFLLAGLSS